MKKNLFTLLSIMLIAASVTAAGSNPEKTDFPTEVLTKMTSFYKMGIDEKLYLQTDKPYYSSGEKIWFKGFLRNAITHTELDHSNFIYVELIEKSNNLVSRVKVKRDSISGFSGYLDLDPELKEGDYTLKGYTRWMLNHDQDYIFNKAIKVVSPIPPTATAAVEQSKKEERKAKAKEAEQQTIVAKAPLDYTVQFFPEGGALLEGVTQIIAFKAVAEDGLSLDVTGEIYNAKDELVKAFSTSHKGMGMTVLVAAEGDYFYAKTRSSNGLEKRFDLPTVESQGAIVTARKSGNRILFQIHATDPSITKNSHIVIHSHGRVVSVSEVNGTQLNAVGLDGLFDGVNSISLIDSENRVISERLFFKRPATLPTLSITPENQNYGARQKAKVTINLKDSWGEAAVGQLGVSVTDNSSVNFEQGDDNILSNLLLTSDLKGYIEAPGLYFTGDLTKADHNLDLLMRTQGWRRFDIEKILNEQIIRPTLKYESQAEISGNVKGFFGNDARKPELIMTCPSLNFIDSFTLDESSRFRLLGVDIPDSATYVIQARTRKGGNSLTLNIDPEPFPLPKSTVLPRSDQFYVPMAFVNQSQEKFYYEGGMDLVNLDAVYVTASVTQSDISSSATHGTGREQLESMSSLPLSMILQMYPGISIGTSTGDGDEDAGSTGVYHRGSSSAAKFLVDGMYMEYDDVSHLTAIDLEKIEFFSGVDAALYSDAAGGIFVIEMRQGSYASPHITAPGIAFVSNLGYQKSATFYQPDYAKPAVKADAKPDFRTTIYWNGALTTDQEGNAHIEFYTADKATSYTITVEGITDQGEISRTTAQISRTASR